MASIRKIEGKHGTAYKITVTLGRDSLDRQIRHYKTWKPEKPMSARELNRELQRVATEFEQDLINGFQADNRQTFAEYAAYCYTIREQRGDKPQTLARVRRQTERINEYIGQIPIQEIRPKTLNDLYKKLSEPGACRWQVFALPAVDFNALIPEGETRKAFAEKCGVYGTLIRRLCENQPISRKNAAIIEEKLGRKDLFKLTGEGKALSPGTVRDYHAIISTVLGQAYKEMIIKYNPADRVTLPKKKRVRESKTLQPEQLKTVLAALEAEPLPFRALITLFISTGCRRGEALALTWDKIDFEKCEILIDRSMIYLPETGIQSGTTKTGNSRRVALPAEMVTLLRKLRAYQTEERLKLGDLWENHNLVFTRWNGAPKNPGNVNLDLDEFCKKHGLPHINPHLFRHSAASILLSNGVDVLTVAGMLGHSDVSTTLDTYAHAIDEAKRKTADCISDTILGKKRA